ncbi:MAG: S1 RNA-binding domain-containing protein [Aquificae bacterium]|nr:S1 RNA-binding domain-containing protein [Aquificota bacterium]
MTNEFEKLLEEYLAKEEEHQLQRGQIVKGTVVAEDDANYYVDIGYKIEAVLPKEEVEAEGKELKVGDEVEAVLVKITNRLQNPRLSLRPLKIKKLTEEIKAAVGQFKPFEATVERIVEKGGRKLGYLISIGGIKALLPLQEATQELKVGDKVKVLILDVKQRGKQLRITASQKRLEEEERKRLIEQYKRQIKEGDVVEGKVIKIDPNKGITLLVKKGLRGFIPLSELSWGRNRNPFDYAEVGERLRAKVLGWSKDDAFLRLSLKQLKPDPWETVEEKYKVGEKYPARVVGMIDKGVFVELEEGVEAYVPKTEIAWNVVPEHPKELLEKGQKVEVVITRLDKERKRIGASIKKAQPKPWEAFYDAHPAGSVVRGVVKAIEDNRVVVELAPGVIGFVTKGNLSWTPIKSAEEVVKVGEERDFMVLGLSRDQIRLGVKQLLPNPYEEIREQYGEGATVTLPVVGVVKGGYLLQFPNGVEAFMPKREATRKLKPGEEVEVRIIKVEPEKQRVVVSMREQEVAEEKKVFEEFVSKQESSGEGAGFTLADILKAKLGGQK